VVFSPTDNIKRTIPILKMRSSIRLERKGGSKGDVFISMINLREDYIGYARYKYGPVKYHLTPT